MFHELHAVLATAVVIFALIGFGLRWMSPLGGAILLGGMLAICLGLWLWLGRGPVGWDNVGHAFLLYYVLLPGLGGAVLGVALAWWRARG
ncbi:hypothetical protein FHY55_08310 [Oceanicola sp. D3]|uniref:hypothetical protein n=1 Tax=Oceanicola sp. D3 TaxID=2587163 RepID=UPI0011219A00|nr:hypothetical protein [Oceanicola sp. D3]QDC09242.1 hypothetical protein FHY55_08310 [Oceanicola sp. D3]